MAAPSAITLPAAAQATAVTTWNGDPVQYVKSVATDGGSAVADATASGQTADGATLVTNDVVLVLTPSPYIYSGIYVAGVAGGTRHADADAPANFVVNMRVPITDGDTYAGRVARYDGAANPTIDSSGLPFVFDPQIITPPS
jgi:hypothetical protein